MAWLGSSLLPGRNPGFWVSVKPGLAHSGFRESGGELALDSEDNLYFDRGHSIVSKFDSAGKGLGDVAPSKAEWEAKNTIQQLSLTVDAATGDLYIDGLEGKFPNQVGVVRRYDSSCHPVFNLEFPMQGCEPVESFGANVFASTPGALAIDPATKSLYVAEGKRGVIAFAYLTVPTVTTTKPLNPTATSATLAGTVNPSGIELNSGLKGCRFEWGEAGAPYEHTEPCETEGGGPIGSGSTPVEVHAAITGLQAAHTYHYRLIASNHNDVNEAIDEPQLGADLSFGPPLIESASALEVTSSGATLQTEVNPQDVDTHLRIEYVTQSHFEALGFSEPFATEPTDLGYAGAAQTATFALTGLAPATAYRYRAVAESALGEGPEAVLGEGLAFTTQSTGTLPRLPDSRQWELVSPPDKLGAALLPNGVGIVEASASGDAITYLANAATEANPPANTNSSVQVLSSRPAQGPVVWASRDISPPHGSSTGFTPFGTPTELRFFSSDLSRAIVQPHGAFTPSISPEASEQTAFLRTDYLGSDPTAFCTTSCYSPLVTAAEGIANVPPGTQFGEDSNCESRVLKEGEPIGPSCGPQFAGATPDLSHVILNSKVALIEAVGNWQLYEWSAGSLTLTSVLPSGKPASSSALSVLGYSRGRGTGVGAPEEIQAKTSARDAISADGSRVVWDELSGKRHLYLRYNATEAQSKVSGSGCTEPEKACTLQLDKVSGGSGQGLAEPIFQAASPDGSKIFFTDPQRLTANSGGVSGKPDLYECKVVESEAGGLECQLTDLTPESSGEAANVQGSVPGVTADGSHLYFVAQGVLTGAEENEHHEKAQAGQPNLYLRHAGTTGFIAVLAPKDRADFSESLGQTPTRTSPDGRFFTFMSQRPLTGYDNRDALTGARDVEVFLYDAAPGPGQPALVCASCNPSGARPRGILYGHLGLVGGKIDGYGGVASEEATIAANLSGWAGDISEGAAHETRNLFDSGRLFFNSSDALSPRDSNGTEDVYEYEPSGAGSCTESSPAFSPRSGGCLSLISSGTSPEESAFLDASEKGNDVFFLTNAQLSRRDVDTALDVYDARVGGGEAEPPKPVECEGDGCQQPASPPNDPTPGSLTFHGAGNLHEEEAPKPRCAKGKVRKGGRCVAKHHRKKGSHKRANANRRAGQ